MLLDMMAGRARADRRRPPARTWQRSLAKTVTWRLFATLDTFVISILVTGNLRWAGSIVGVEIFSKMALYFLHERAWAWSAWGAPAKSVPARHPSAA